MQQQADRPVLPLPPLCPHPALLSAGHMKAGINPAILRSKLKLSWQQHSSMHGNISGIAQLAVGALSTQPA